LKKNASNLTILPLVIGDFSFHEMPPEIAKTNGLKLDVYNIKTIAFTISSYFTKQEDLIFNGRRWCYPKPGDWLKVCKMDEWTESNFNIGDLVYFIRISPLGLFECYAPKTEDLFWFYSENLCPAEIVDENRELERAKVPKQYRILNRLIRELNYERTQSKKLAT
jgi:hypothetical protein